MRKYLALLKCTLGVHNYYYEKRFLFGISLFGSSYDEHKCRECKNCGKTQVLIRKNYEDL